MRFTKTAAGAGVFVAACAACCAPLVGPWIVALAAGGAGLALAGQIGLGVLLAAGLAFYVIAQRRRPAAKRIKAACACGPATGCNSNDAPKPLLQSPDLLPSNRNS